MWRALQSLCRSLVGAKCAPTASSSDRSFPPTIFLDPSWSLSPDCFQKRSAINERGFFHVNVLCMAVKSPAAAAAHAFQTKSTTLLQMASTFLFGEHIEENVKMISALCTQLLLDVPVI